MASFFYSFVLLMKRDWTIFWRDKMKFGTCLLNAIMRFLLAGLLFINTIPSREEIALNPVICFIGIQGFAFNCTASSIMPAINTVALASILWIIQFLLRGNFTSRRRIPRSTTLFLTSCRKCSSCFLELKPAPSSFA